ncbi:MAG: transcription factor S [Candidatus Hodarchaeota archaeon]
MVEFCEKCGALLFPEKKKSKTVLKCRRCGTAQEPDQAVDYRVRSEIRHSIKDETIIIDGDEKKLSVLPTTSTVCPKCHNTVAYYWMVQTRSADEAMTTFLRCQKCGHTWREYG